MIMTVGGYSWIDDELHSSQDYCLGSLDRIEWGFFKSLNGIQKSTHTHPPLDLLETHFYTISQTAFEKSIIGILRVMLC